MINILFGKSINHLAIIDFEKQNQKGDRLNLLIALLLCKHVYHMYVCLCAYVCTSMYIHIITQLLKIKILLLIVLSSNFCWVNLLAPLTSCYFEQGPIINSFFTLNHSLSFSLIYIIIKFIYLDIKATQIRAQRFYEICKSLGKKISAFNLM